MTMPHLENCRHSDDGWCLACVKELWEKTKQAKGFKAIGIVGSRRRDTEEDLVACQEAFGRLYQDGDVLVSGGCPHGADRFAEMIARGHGLSITIHHADWVGLGRAAGFVRNSKIAEDCDVLIALVSKDRTGGTEDTVRKAIKLGKQIVYA